MALNKINPEQFMPKEKWYKKGIRFECQGSGQCCVSRGEYGYVYLNLKDRKAMAKELKLTTSIFTRKYCQKTDGSYHLKQNPKEIDCVFLKNNRCQVYKARPTQCRTWPFWPENMNAKTWSQEVAGYCPGVGKGQLFTEKEIEDTLREQIISEIDP